MRSIIKVSPSILSADFLHLEQEIKAIEDAKADFIHVDVMDGSFVPNLTFGPLIIKHLKKVTKLPVEAHLMISNAESCVDDYIKSGADIIIIHVEACIHLDRIINKIKQAGIKVGVALNPSTNEDCLKYVLDLLDVVLVMTVNPGFGGQKFLYSQIKKIKNLKKTISLKRELHEPKTLIEVDGGIDNETVREVINAGADIVVVGSYIFNNDGNKENYSEKISILKKSYD